MFMKKLSIIFAASLTFVAFGTAPAHAGIMGSPGLLDIAQDGEITVTQPIYDDGTYVTGGATAIRACKNEVAQASGVDEASAGPLVGVADCITLVTSQGVTTVPASGVNIFTTYLQGNGNYSDLYQTYPHVGYLVEAVKVGASSVYSWTATIDVRTLSGAPASSPTEVAAPSPAPYRGPAPSAYSVAKPAPGDNVVISGKRMNLVSSCTVDGVELTITNQSADSLTIEIPETMEAGLKDLVMTGSAGKLTVIGAFAVEEPKVNVGSMNGHIAVYAKGHKGKTLSWKIAGKWFSTTVQSDYQVFQRKTVGVGKNVNVDLYIDGEKTLSTSVTTK
jgi:hypothetical protein